MTSQQACAHLNISWRIEEGIGNTERGWWECDSGCGATFEPSNLARHYNNLEDVKDAAQIIFNAVTIHGDKTCIHGIGTEYPAPAWYCDDCWRGLEEALAQYGDE